ncbi:MAG: hypothetical protein LUF35_04855 [Lachnospiraceae bacterium]|nr:hypothetical protein [Lachnospiraceae bacterium]
MKRIRWKDLVAYRELTLDGVILCALVGLAAEILILMLTGIKAKFVSPVVLLFLWLLSGILVSGVLIVFAAFADLRRAYFKDWEFASVCQSVRYESLTDEVDDAIILMRDFDNTRTSSGSAA